MRLTRTPRALRSLVPALAAALLVTACGLPGSGGTASQTAADASACPAPRSAPSGAGATPLTPEQAGQIVRQLWQQWDRDGLRSSAFDCDAETQTEEGPAFATSVANDQIVSDLHRPAHDRPNPIQALRVYVPHQTRYPLWFAAIAKVYDVDQDTGRVSGTVVYRFMVVTRMGPEARWKEYLDTDVPGGDPAVALDAEGYASGPVGTPVIEPSALPEAYVDYLRSGGTEHADLFAPGQHTDKMVKGTATTRTERNSFEPYGGRTFTLPMKDGSRMVVFTGAWDVRLLAGSGKCYSQDQKRTKLPVYFPPGDWKEIDLGTLMARVAFVPSGSGQVQLSGDDGLILSKGVGSC